MVSHPGFVSRGEGEVCLTLPIPRPLVESAKPLQQMLWSRDAHDRRRSGREMASVVAAAGTMQDPLSDAS